MPQHIVKTSLVGVLLAAAALSGVSPANAPTGTAEPVILPAIQDEDIQAPDIGSALVLPAQGVTTPIVEAPAVLGVMHLPEPSQAGWLTQSAPIDSEAGTTVLAGHINWHDGSYAPMSSLYHLYPDDHVYITGSENQLWQVVDRTSVNQGELSDVMSLTDTTGPRRMLLVTCKETEEGYTDNLVITLEKIM